jgi:putative transposase
VHSVSTRSVDDLVAARGIDSSISKSEVPRTCAASTKSSARSGLRFDQTRVSIRLPRRDYLQVRGHLFAGDLDGGRGRHEEITTENAREVRPRKRVVPQA